MKASHRKDVIIARLIFAAICLFLIALIVTIVITVNSKGGKKKEQDKVQQMAVQQELQIVLHSHSNRYVVR